MKEKFKPLDKKDLPKLIGLVALAVGAFVFALFQLAPTTSASSAKPKTAATARATGTAAKTAAAGGGDKTAATDTTFVADDIAVLTSGKDPFVPNGPAAALDATTTAAAAAKAAPAAKPAPDAAPVVREITPPRSPQSEPSPVAPPHFNGSPDVTVVAKTAPAAILPPPVPPAYVVTGVVRGQNPDGSDNIAILRGGNGGNASGPAAAAPPTERRFVRTGDAVGNGFVVVAVRRDGVTLAHGSSSGDKSRVTLTLGDNSRAK